MKKNRVLTMMLTLLLSACQSQPPSTDRFGVLIMAHGGSSGWNEQVKTVVAPLRADQPTALAFGMADANTMAVAVRELEAQGVNRIGVLRLFISGESFLTETEQILGLRAGAPAASMLPPAAASDAHAGHGSHQMGFFRLDSKARFQLSTDGLLQAPEMGHVLASRALELSTDPLHEDVLILAHGPGDDGENERWLQQLEARAEVVRASAPFRRVQVATLREDWPDKRVAAEQSIRRFVERASQENGHALVLSYRVAGFGPYHEVLKGLSYRASEKGLLPHAEVSHWLHQEAQKLAKSRND